MKRMIFSAALVAGAAMLMGAGSAAAVTIDGKVQIVGVRPGSGYNYIYVVPRHVSTVSTIQYCVTSDDTIAMVAKNALEKNLTVYMRCSYSAWSSGYGGSVDHLNIYRSF